MDTISHGLWGYGLFGFRGHPKLAILFGILPDLLSFGILMIIQLINGNFVPGPPPLETIPNWTIYTYNFTHSLIVAGFFIGIVHIKWRQYSFPMLAWPFHLLLDIPFHTEAYFPTKLFWPLNNFYFNGIVWSNPWVWFSNIAGLVILFLYRWQNRKTSRG